MSWFTPVTQINCVVRFANSVRYGVSSARSVDSPSTNSTDSAKLVKPYVICVIRKRKMGKDSAC